MTDTMGINLYLGHAQIDHDHLRLFDLVGRLAAAVDDGSSRAVWPAVVDELEAYARTHFFTEEELMRRHRYAEIEAHVAEHRRFSEYVDSLRRQAEASGDDVSPELLRFLRAWLGQHIATADQALVEAIPPA